MSVGLNLIILLQCQPSQLRSIKLEIVSYPPPQQSPHRSFTFDVSPTIVFTSSEPSLPLNGSKKSCRHTSLSRTRRERYIQGGGACRWNVQMREMWSRVVCEQAEASQFAAAAHDTPVTRSRARHPHHDSKHPVFVPGRDPECGSTPLDKLFERLLSILSNFKVCFEGIEVQFWGRKFMEKNEGA